MEESNQRLDSQTINEITFQAVEDVVRETFGDEAIKYAYRDEVKSRYDGVVFTRHVIFYLSKRASNLISSVAIGRKYGYDHSTVLHGIQSVENEAKFNKDFKEFIETLLDATKAVAKIGLQVKSNIAAKNSIMRALRGFKKNIKLEQKGGENDKRTRS